MFSLSLRVERRYAARSAETQRFLKRGDSIEIESTSQIIQDIVIIGFKLLQPCCCGSAGAVLWIGSAPWRATAFNIRPLFLPALFSLLDAQGKIGLLNRK
jgi:hypothetical protein